MALKPAEKADLIDKLLCSLDKPDGQAVELWRRETEARIDAFERGEIKAITLKRVLRKYR